MVWFINSVTSHSPTEGNSKISLEANLYIDLLRPNRQQNYLNLGESITII